MFLLILINIYDHNPSREASSIVASIIDDPNYDRSADANILPAIAMQRRFADDRDRADHYVELYEFNVKMVMIGYGSDMQIIGELEIMDSTTYHDLKEKVKPLVKEYLSFCKLPIVQDLIENFVLLDNHKVPVIGRSSMVTYLFTYMHIFIDELNFTIIL